MFKIGDQVEWITNVSGVSKTLNGVVVKVLHADDPSGPRRIAQTEFPKHQRMFNGYGIPDKADVGYLVESADCLYMPNPKSLTGIALSEADVDAMLKKDYKHDQQVMKRHVVNFHRFSTRGAHKPFAMGNKKNHKGYVFDKNGCLRRLDKLN